MKSVGAYEAKTNLSKLQERVQKGERITITKHGVAIAVLQPPEPEVNADVKMAIAELREFREKHCLKGLSIRKMLEEGRK